MCVFRINNEQSSLVTSARKSGQIHDNDEERRCVMLPVPDTCVRKWVMLAA